MAVWMTRSEREAFFADVHVGVLSVADEGSSPLSVPVWYSYVPGGTVNVITGVQSKKSQLIAKAGRFSICAQSEAPPYKYVTVRGPLVRTDKPVDPNERRDLAHRYLGQEAGDLWLQSTEAEAAGEVVLRMAPETWLTADFAKQFG